MVLGRYLILGYSDPQGFVNWAEDLRLRAYQRMVLFGSETLSPLPRGSKVVPFWL